MSRPGPLQQTLSKSLSSASLENFALASAPPHSQLRFRFPEEGNLPRRFWQRRYYAFNVYSRRKLREKLDYMHANPVIEKLVKDPKDWPWSSWSAYLGRPALLAIDFAG